MAMGFPLFNLLSSTALLRSKEPALLKSMSQGEGKIVSMLCYIISGAGVEAGKSFDLWQLAGGKNSTKQ